MKINEVQFPVKKNTNLEKAVELIKNKCSEFLPIYKKYGPLYRGIENNKFDKMPEIFIANSPTNRTPMSMSATFQNIIDKKLKKVGFTALRNNSIFCSVDRSTAFEYGYDNGMYIIFPYNGFSFTYSAKIHDLFNYINDNISNRNLIIDMPAEKLVKILRFKKENLSMVYERYKDNETGILYYPEIYIHGKYIAVKERYLLTLEMKELKK